MCLDGQESTSVFSFILFIDTIGIAFNKYTEMCVKNQTTWICYSA